MFYNFHSEKEIRIKLEIQRDLNPNKIQAFVINEALDYHSVIEFFKDLSHTYSGQTMPPILVETVPL